MTYPDLVGLFVEPLERYLASGSDRHLRDVAAMLKVSRDEIDGDDLERWLTSPELQDALQSAEGTNL